MKNLLSLHESIIITLVNIDKESFTSSFDDISDYITKSDLYLERKENNDLATQIMLRSTKSKGNYANLFEQISRNEIKLRNK